MHKAINGVFGSTWVADAAFGVRLGFNCMDLLERNNGREYSLVSFEQFHNLSRDALFVLWRAAAFSTRFRKTLLRALVS